jgi:hypothetical protein
VDGGCWWESEEYSFGSEFLGAVDSRAGVG